MRARENNMRDSVLTLGNTRILARQLGSLGVGRRGTDLRHARLQIPEIVGPQAEVHQICLGVSMANNSSSRQT